GAAVARDQFFLEKERIGDRDVFRHLASERYSSSRSLRLSRKASSRFRRGACWRLRAKYSRIASPSTACSRRPSREASCCSSSRTSGSACEENFRKVLTIASS